MPHANTFSYLTQTPVRKAIKGQGGQGLNHSRAASPCEHQLVSWRQDREVTDQEQHLQSAGRKLGVVTQGGDIAVSTESLPGWVNT